MLVDVLVIYRFAYIHGSYVLLADIHAKIKVYTYKALRNEPTSTWELQSPLGLNALSLHYSGIYT